MNRQIRELRRDLEKPRPKGYEPFDRYAYNAFAWTAKWWETYAKTQEERDETARLRLVAIAKRKVLEEQNNDRSQNTGRD